VLVLGGQGQFLVAGVEMVFEIILSDFIIVGGVESIDE